MAQFAVVFVEAFEIVVEWPVFAGSVVGFVVAMYFAVVEVPQVVAGEVLFVPSKSPPHRWWSLAQQ